MLSIQVCPTLPCATSQSLSSGNIHPAEVKRVSSRGQACTQTCSFLLTLAIGLSGCVHAAKPLFIVSVKVRVGKDMSEIPMCHVHTAPLVLLSHCLERHKRQTSLLSLCKCSLVIFIPVLSGEYKGRVRSRAGSTALPALSACPASSRGTRTSPFPSAPEQSVLLLPPCTPPGEPLPAGVCAATGFPSRSIPTPRPALVQPLPGRTARERRPGKELGAWPLLLPSFFSKGLASFPRHTGRCLFDIKPHKHQDFIFWFCQRGLMLPRAVAAGGLKLPALSG